METSPSSSERPSAVADSGDRRRGGGREALAENRAAAQHAALELAEPIQPGGDQRVDARRDVEIVDLADQPVAMRVPGGDHRPAGGEHAK